MTPDVRPTLAIVIVNWNTGDQLRDCIQSLSHLRTDNFHLAAVVVVDNASTDDSLDACRGVALPMHIIRNGSNRGFAAACNQGAQAAQANYLLFLNPDTRLFADSLRTPMSFLLDPVNASIGICGIQLLDDIGSPSTSAARFPNMRSILGASLGLDRALPKFFPPTLLTSRELRESCTVDQVIGAFFLIRRHVYEACGGFDESFFVYFEEVDLALRAGQLGYSSYYLASATAFHKGGGASGQVKSTRLFYSLRSRLIYVRKHFGTIQYACVWLLTFAELAVRLVRAAAVRSASDASNTLGAYWKLTMYALGRR